MLFSVNVMSNNFTGFFAFSTDSDKELRSFQEFLRKFNTDKFFIFTNHNDGKFNNRAGKPVQSVRQSGDRRKDAIFTQVLKPPGIDFCMAQRSFLFQTAKVGKHDGNSRGAKRRHTGADCRRLRRFCRPYSTTVLTRERRW